MDKRNACAYIRVSDERQDEYSPESQRKRIVQYAETHQLMLRPEFIFYDDGISARTVQKRTAFQRMIALARSEEHPFSVILVWKYSRFARNQEESIVYKNLLEKTGVEVISVSEPVTDDPFGTLIERIIEWMDEYYVINLASEVRRGMAEKASRGEAMGRAVLGYDRTEKSYIPNSDAPLVTETFNRFAAGASLRELTEYLAVHGVKTTRGHAPSDRWVAYLLQNPVYIGQIRWSSDGRVRTSDSIICVSDAHPALVSESLFAKVQQRFESLRHGQSLRESRGGTAEWPLRGLLYCSSCGGPLVRAGSKYPSVQCSRYAKKQCRVSHALSLRRAEQAIFSALSPILVRIPVKSPTAYGGWAVRLGYAEDRLRRVTAAYQAGIDSLSEYQTAKARCMEMIHICEQHLQGSAPVPNTAADFLTADLPVDLKNRVLGAGIARIVYDKSAACLHIYLRMDKSQNTVRWTGW